VELRVPFRTLLKIALFLLLAVCVIKLWPVVLMAFVATLIAVMLDPIVGWLEAHRVRRGIAIAAIAVLLLALICGFAFGVIPASSAQLREIGGDLPQIRARLLRAFPLLSRVPPLPPMQQFLIRGLAAGASVVEGITVFFFVLVLAFYLLIEGQTTFEWLVSFAPKEQRPRWRKTAGEIGGVMRAYMRGQVITSLICGGWALLVLMVLRVPGAVVLALIAAVADLVPVIGTIAMTVPAAAMALLVGPTQSLLVIAAYLLYHLVESYFIVPRVYGSQMRLSTLTVLVAVAVGGVLQGALGAILILPLVAAYPIIERIWLREELPPDTVARHEAIEGGATPPAPPDRS
jgi:predicted PurR-regulated permease PerM